jgi:hypothetical protein
MDEIMVTSQYAPAPSSQPDIKKFYGISDDPFCADDGRFFIDREDVIALGRASV